MNIAVVLCAGSGKRMGMPTPKQFLTLAGHPVISYSLRAFEDSEKIDKIVCAVGFSDVDGKSQSDIVKCIAKEYHIDKLSQDDIVLGGKTRQETVFNALEHISSFAGDDDIVAIHDGVRALITKDDVDKLIGEMHDYECVTFAKRTTSTLAKTSSDLNIEDYVKRDTIYELQTPQCFRFSTIFDCHMRLLELKFCSLDDIVEDVLIGFSEITDDTGVVKIFGNKVKIVENENPNFKLTDKSDIHIFELLLKEKQNEI